MSEYTVSRNEERIAEARTLLAHYVEALPSFYLLKTRDTRLGFGVAAEAVSVASEHISEMAHALACMEVAHEGGDLPTFGVHYGKFLDLRDRLCGTVDATVYSQGAASS